MPSVFADKREGLKKSLSALRGESILVLIGPEGGFDLTEIDAASKRGVRLISLGENILRCDTAAIATIAAINYALSDI